MRGLIWFTTRVVSTLIVAVLIGAVWAGAMDALNIKMARACLIISSLFTCEAQGLGNMSLPIWPFVPACELLIGVRDGCCL